MFKDHEKPNLRLVINRKGLPKPNEKRLQKVGVGVVEGTFDILERDEADETNEYDDNKPLDFNNQDDR